MQVLEEEEFTFSGMVSGLFLAVYPYPIGPARDLQTMHPQGTKPFLHALNSSNCGKENGRVTAVDGFYL